MRSNTISRRFSTLPMEMAAPGLAGAPRKVSLAMAATLLGAADAGLLLLTGFASLAVAAFHVDGWRLGALVVLLGTMVAATLMRAASLHGAAVLDRRGVATGRAALTWTATIVALAVLDHATGDTGGRFDAWLGAWLGLGLASLVLDRRVLARLLTCWERQGRLCRTVAVLGAGPLGERLLRRLAAASETRIRIAGVYDGSGHASQYCRGHGITGSIDDLVDEVRRGGIDEVLIALADAVEQRLAIARLKLCPVPVTIRVCAGALGVLPRAAGLAQMGGLTLITAADAPLAGWRGVAKAIEDRVIAALALILLGLPMLLIALAIRLDSPGPVLFRQRRHGLNNRLIEVLKFRTMYAQDCDPDAHRLTRRDDPRVTRLGAILRDTMLDELPQLINVLRGDMSIVGPRPHALYAKAGGLLYAEAVPHYDARHRMKPGMTGWAQVNGWRGTTDTVEQIEKRIACDLHYVEHWSVRLDLAIIWRTAMLVLHSLRRR